MAQGPPKTFSSDFDILEPGTVHDPNTGIVDALADPADTIWVRVQNNAPQPGDSFLAQIYAFGTVVPVGPSKILAPEDGTNQFFSGRVVVGLPLNNSFSGMPNKTLQVTKNSTPPGQNLDFEAAWPPGSSGSGSGSQMASMARPAALSQADKPVPAALCLQVDPPASVGDAASAPLDRQTTLSFSGSSADECCWISPPVDAYSDRSAPAFWMLRTADARTWVLLLRRGSSDVVVYHFTTPDEKGGAFPIRMHLASGGRSWPRSVTVSPAL